MKKNHNITKFIIIVPLVFIIVAIISMFSISSSLLNTHFDNEYKNYIENELKLQKQHIKNQIDSVYNYIEYKKTETPKRLKHTLKDRVYMAYNVANNIYIENKNKLSQKQIQKEIQEALRKMRFGDNGYFFIVHMKSETELISKLLPATPKEENTNIYSQKDGNGKLYLQEFAKTIKEKNEGFVQYKWFKLTNKQKHDKISFIKHFEPFNWIIGYGAYFEDIENNIKQEAIKRLDLFRYDDTGYIWTLDTKGMLVQHPYRKDDIGKYNKIKDIQTQEILSELLIRKALEKEEGSFVEYNWNKINETKKIKKIGYVRHIKDWDWIVGTGVYLKDINENILSLEKKEADQIKGVIYQTLGIWLYLHKGTKSDTRLKYSLI